MKIIFYRYNSICEPDLIDAFKALQLEVIEERTEMTQKNIAAKEQIALVSRLILEHQPLFVFSINFFPVISDVCQRLNVLYVALSVDCPVLELFDRSITNTNNRIFLFDRAQYEDVRRYNPDCVFHMPLAVNPQRYDEPLADLRASDFSVSSYLYDVSFVGSLYREKSPLPSLPLSPYEKGYLEGLLAAQQCFPYGMILQEGLTEPHIEAIKNADAAFYTPDKPVTDTDGYVAAHYYLAMEYAHRQRIMLLNTLAQAHRIDLFTRSSTDELHGVVCHGGVSTHTEMPVVFYRSRINLNITIPSIRDGLPQRIWDILGCGGFLLTDCRSELPLYFTAGRHLDCYESAQECSEKITYYLSHDDIRMEIADAGYRLVKEKHTYIHRAAQMLQICSDTYSRSIQTP